MTTRNYNHTGWATIDGQHAFLSTTGSLGTEGLNSNVRVDLGTDNLGRYALPPAPANLRPAVQASLDFLSLAPHSITLPLWASMYAAPLTPINPLGAVLWIYGPAQCGKSLIAHLALAHFGASFVDHQGYHAPKDWSATPAELEQAMFRIKDAPIVIDGYAPDPSASFFEARQTTQKAHYVVRSVSNPPRRHDLPQPPDGQFSPRGLVISTATNRLTGSSISARVIHVPVEVGQVLQANEKGNGQETRLDEAQHQAAAGLYAQAMAGYVAWLAKNWQRLGQELPGRFYHTQHAGRRHLPPGQSWLVNHYSLLATAANLALEYAHHHGVLTQDDVEQQSGIHRHNLVELLCSQAGQSKQTQ